MLDKMLDKMLQVSPLALDIWAAECQGHPNQSRPARQILAKLGCCAMLRGSFIHE